VSGVDITVEYKDLSATDAEQLSELIRCFELFRERNERYQDLWKQGGIEDSIHHIRSKSARVIWASTHLSLAQQVEAIDDPQDLVNYSVFYMRNLLAARGEERGCRAPGCRHLDCDSYAVLAHEQDDIG